MLEKIQLALCGKWLEVSMMLAEARCPYCVSGGEFQHLEEVRPGEMRCPKCGHSISGDGKVQCVCSRCSDLRALILRKE